MKKINENIKHIIVLIVAIVISSMISIKAATTLSSTSVYYDTSKSGGSSSNVNGAIDELYSLTTDRDKLKADIVNIIYPVGSIYMSTEDDTVEKVQDKFGGTWVRYAEDTTLVGYKNNTNEVNETGGSKTATLTLENVPSHTHDVTASGSVSSTFTGTRILSESTGSGYSIGYGYSNRTTTANGSHYHEIPIYRDYTGGSGGNLSINGLIKYAQIATPITSNSTGNHSHTVSDYYATSISGVASHQHYYTASGSVSSTFTGSKVKSTSTGSGSSFNVQNPYTVVYMYKRTA